MPPIVSMPRLSGVTSNNRTSVRSPASTLPCTAAPAATASSGLTSRRGALPNNFSTTSCTFGIRVIPPTRITSSMSAPVTPASFIAVLQGSIERWISSSTSCSNLARLIVTFMCLGPLASAVMYGKFTDVCAELDNSILAFSAASFRRCRASISCFKSTALSFLNSSIKKSIMRWSKSSPPRNVSPFVDNTSICLSPSTFAISMIETSNVPPPKS